MEIEYQAQDCERPVQHSIPVGPIGADPQGWFGRNRGRQVVGRIFFGPRSPLTRATSDAISRPG
jgi:hypothetical protein